MNASPFPLIRWLYCILSCAACLTKACGQSLGQPPQLTKVELLPNHEVALTVGGPVGFNIQVDASSDLSVWNPLVTLADSVSPIQYTDSAAPFLMRRYYRARTLQQADPYTGDHLATADGEVIIHPLFHASFIMEWKNKIIYSDPDDDPAYASRYPFWPKGDLILISHSHTDHFSVSQIDAVRRTNAVIIVPQPVFNSLTAAQKAMAVVLTNGASTNVLGLTVDATPAYNSYHPRGTGNGYVLTIGNKRIYISGDTGNIAETRALTNIDVAFVCMNQPFTMTANEATNAVRPFRPKVIYPYHYRDQSGSTANADLFKQRLGTDAGIEVRLRNWY